MCKWCRDSEMRPTREEWLLHCVFHCFLARPALVGKLDSWLRAARSAVVARGLSHDCQLLPALGYLCHSLCADAHRLCADAQNPNSFHGYMDYSVAAPAAMNRNRTMIIGRCPPNKKLALVKYGLVNGRASSYVMAKKAPDGIK